MICAAVRSGAGSVTSIRSMPSIFRIQVSCRRAKRRCAADHALEVAGRERPRARSRPPRCARSARASPPGLLHGSRRRHRRDPGLDPRVEPAAVADEPDQQGRDAAGEPSRARPSARAGRVRCAAAPAPGRPACGRSGGPLAATSAGSSACSACGPRARRSRPRPAPRTRAPQPAAAARARPASPACRGRCRRRGSAVLPAAERGRRSRRAPSSAKRPALNSSSRPAIPTSRCSSAGPPASAARRIGAPLIISSPR